MGSLKSTLWQWTEILGVGKFLVGKTCGENITNTTNLLVATSGRPKILFRVWNFFSFHFGVAIT